MARIVIVQPYVPAYRRALFDGLSERLRSQGHELVIASGQPRREQAERRDGVRLRSATEQRYTSRSLVLGPLEVRLAPGARAWKRADVVIVELAAGSLSSFRALVGRRPVGVWGHVGSYVAGDRSILRALRAWQVRRADHVLAYTRGGADTAVAYGARPTDVTALRNTVETDPLRRAVRAAREQEPGELRSQLGAPTGSLFAVIGGLDESKRIDLMAATLERLWSAGSDVRLLVAGSGAQEKLLHPARDRGQVVLLGYADAPVKAKMARVCTAIFNPGRVGLVAVESFALGLPIITTAEQGHGPEFEYLRPGEDCLLTAPDPESMARALIELAGDPIRSTALAQAAEGRAGDFPLASMIDSMDRAISKLLAKR